MNKLKTTPLSYAITRGEDNAVFGETAIHVSLEDNAAGPFAKIHQLTHPEGEKQHPGVVFLDVEELEEVLKIAKKLCKENT